MKQLEINVQTHKVNLDEKLAKPNFFPGVVIKSIQIHHPIAITPNITPEDYIRRSISSNMKMNK